MTDLTQTPDLTSSVVASEGDAPPEAPDADPVNPAPVDPEPAEEPAAPPEQTPLGVPAPPPPDEPLVTVTERLVDGDGFLLYAEGSRIPESRARELGLV